MRVALIQEGFDITDVSMIEAIPISFSPNIPDTDWIFFSSKNAVEFFFSQKPILKNQKFAAIGSGTAAILPVPHALAWVGDTNDIERVAHEFEQLIQGQTVLFPQSEVSLQTVQKALKEEQIINLICYKTAANPQKVHAAQVLVFTSPSNVKAYLQLNSILPTQRLIAFGKSTARCLYELGYAAVNILPSLTPKELLNTISHS
jgi:uroporphyrinogen-III synthase